MNKQKLASKIWAQANAMRSKIEAHEYKDYILGFIFYKFLSDKEVELLKKDGYTDEDMKLVVEDDEKVRTYIQEKIGYFICYNDLFYTWLKNGKDFDVSNVRDALNAFSRLISPRYKKVYENIFNTLQTGLSKLGDGSGSQTKAINELIQLIKDIPMDGKQDYDVLGFIYEYLISMFAANAGKKAGEFYTPHEVSLLMSEIVANHLKGSDKIEIYDPTSGSGSLLINIGKSISKYMTGKDKVKYFAQEWKENTYNLTRMNLVMRGIIPDNIVTRCGDTLEEDWPFFDESDKSRTYQPLYLDAVVSNPPYSQKWDPLNKEFDPRYADFGTAPKSKADYAFLLHDLYHLKPSGIMTIVLPHGVLFRGGEEETIRKNLIEKNHIDAIIGLPANIFFGTGIPTIIMVLRQKRENTDVLIVDASKGFIKVGKNNKLQESNIKKIVDAVVRRENITKFSRVVEREEIRTNGYNLNIPRYVDSSDKAESFDIFATMFGGIPYSEIDEIVELKEFATLKDQIFKAKDKSYAQIADGDIKQIIANNADVKAFIAKFNRAFADFSVFLITNLIDNLSRVVVSKIADNIAESIFDRLAFTRLIDKYKAYQLFADDWKVVSTDLEIIQTEGFAATRKVDPNMVTKKKDGKDEEVQEGYVGRILPFELIQNNYLSAETKALKAKEKRLLEIEAELLEILESISEEDKTSDLFNDDGEFIAKELAKQAKQLAKTGTEFCEESLEWKILKTSELTAEAKELKKQIKIDSEKLHAKTKETIENLTDAEVFKMLIAKWVMPLVSSINQMPNTLIAELTSKIKNLAAKYQTTFIDIDTKIEAAEKELSAMIDDLTGSEYDMAGLKELQKLLKGGEDE